ncbi:MULTISPECIES: SGNH/GDSL hydrolase family protein [unclassified Rathayibacter]|uniref:SGNH/GDSL hydrolase family protein n=1 Tax=unclassified Rathayibacter TaxID=2609250 RepID=UPI001052A1AB|nr:MULTISPECIES: SGNH/GDSL hydrolase family protein [unclassified Rathayibacter]TCL85508.1 lysophospholipase L1-like esterase [Rathayibacter sp. PhB192]TCM31329.1 lysophospholipase L1-like esterase [Rathayibacter sp. PhB179]
MAGLAAVIAALERIWPENRAVNVVFHGHSVPAGYFATPLIDRRASYPHVVAGRLAERHPHAVLNAIVTAVGGEHSESGARRMGEVLGHRPDVVVLDYALNDRVIGLGRAGRAWESMIASVLGAGAVPVLITPSPDLTADPTDPADELVRHAEQIRGLAERDGVLLADPFRVFLGLHERGEPLAGLMSQANHPNGRGHAIIAAEILALFAETEPAGEGSRSE